MIPGWTTWSARLGAPTWLEALEPYTTGMLAQHGLKMWTFDGTAAIGIRAGGVIYPVFPEPWNPAAEKGAREILGRAGDAWCVIGPSAWVARAEILLSPFRLQARVEYDFLVRPPAALSVTGDLGDVRSAREADNDALFPLQEAYEKEEVLFDPAEFQPLASRLHFWKVLRHQEIAALWQDGNPVAKAGTNALTARWGQIGGVYTSPEHRGRGLQKRLMAFLLNRLAVQGRGACLFVKKTNGPAIALYRALGFRPGGDFTITYGERRGRGFL
jgi:ribosomal protein S18 acetylase RimI-like enzyme